MPVLRPRRPTPGRRRGGLGSLLGLVTVITDETGLPCARALKDNPLSLELILLVNRVDKVPMVRIGNLNRPQPSMRRARRRGGRRPAARARRRHVTVVRVVCSMAPAIQVAIIIISSMDLVS